MQVPFAKDYGGLKKVQVEMLQQARIDLVGIWQVLARISPAS